MFHPKINELKRFAAENEHAGMSSRTGLISKDLKGIVFYRDVAPSRGMAG